MEKERNGLRKLAGAKESTAVPVRESWFPKGNPQNRTSNQRNPFPRVLSTIIARDQERSQREARKLYKISDALWSHG